MHVTTKIRQVLEKRKPALFYNIRFSAYFRLVACFILSALKMNVNERLNSQLNYTEQIKSFQKCERGTFSPVNALFREIQKKVKEKKFGSFPRNMKVGPMGDVRLNYVLRQRSKGALEGNFTNKKGT